MDDETGKFQTDPNLTFDHPYPATKVMFLPDRDSSRADLLATTGDFLRIWHVSESGVRLEKLLNTVRLAPRLKQVSVLWAPDSHSCVLQNKNTDYCAPLTSFDWNEVDPKRLGTASIDTTCTIWDIEVRATGPARIAAHGPGMPTQATMRTLSFPHLQKGVVDTQLIAHDREVYDIAWGGGGAGVFASVSADGSVRVFDLRCTPGELLLTMPHVRLGADQGRVQGQGAQHHHLRVGGARPAAAQAGLEQAGPPVPGHPGHGQRQGEVARLRGAVHPAAPSLCPGPAVAGAPWCHVNEAVQAVILDIRFPTLPVAELQRHQGPCERAGLGAALVLPHLHGWGRRAGAHLGPDHHGQTPGAEPGCVRC